MSNLKRACNRLLDDGRECGGKVLDSGFCMKCHYNRCAHGRFRMGKFADAGRCPECYSTLKPEPIKVILDPHIKEIITVKKEVDKEVILCDHPITGQPIYSLDMGESKTEAKNVLTYPDGRQEKFKDPMEALAAVPNGSTLATENPGIKYDPDIWSAFLYGAIERGITVELTPGRATRKFAILRGWELKKTLSDKIASLSIGDYARLSPHPVGQKSPRGTYPHQLLRTKKDVDEYFRKKVSPCRYPESELNSRIREARELHHLQYNNKVEIVPLDLKQEIETILARMEQCPDSLKDIFGPNYTSTAFIAYLMECIRDPRQTYAEFARLLGLSDYGSPSEHRATIYYMKRAAFQHRVGGNRFQTAMRYFFPRAKRAMYGGAETMKSPPEGKTTFNPAPPTPSDGGQDQAYSPEREEQKESVPQLPKPRKPQGYGSRNHEVEN